MAEVNSILAHETPCIDLKYVTVKHQNILQ